MTKDDRLNVKVESETRSKDVSKMIGEGGLGAEKYYNIKKPAPSAQDKTKEDNHEKEDKK